MSVTVQVTVVVPFGNDAGASLTTEATPQLSAVVGEPRATCALAVLQAPGSVGTSVRFAGAVIVGGVVSLTVTVKLQEVVLLAASSAV